MYDELTLGLGQHPYAPELSWQHVWPSAHSDLSGQTIVSALHRNTCKTFTVYHVSCVFCFCFFVCQAHHCGAFNCITCIQYNNMFTHSFILHSIYIKKYMYTAWIIHCSLTCLWHTSMNEYNYSLYHCVCVCVCTYVCVCACAGCVCRWVGCDLVSVHCIPCKNLLNNSLWVFILQPWVFTLCFMSIHLHL